MADRPLPEPLPADLPEDWSDGQIVAPSGPSVGLSERHGYNYLMAAVNAAQRAANTINEGFDAVSGKRTCRFVVGASTAGWTQADCDFLCDGTDDQEEINQAIAALPQSGGDIVILSGTYNLSEEIEVYNYNGNKPSYIALSGGDGNPVLECPGLQFSAGSSPTTIQLSGLTVKYTNTGTGRVSASGSISMVVRGCIFIDFTVFYGANGTPVHSAYGLLCIQNRFEIKNLSNNAAIFAQGVTNEAQSPFLIANNVIVASPSGRYATVLHAGVMGYSSEMGVVSGNTLICGEPYPSISVRNGIFIGNHIFNANVYASFGAVVAGNILKGGSISGDSGGSREQVNISGNKVESGNIICEGDTLVSGNCVSPPDGKDGIRVINITVGNIIGPAVSGNIIQGGEYGIHLIKPNLSGLEQSHAFITGNRIFEVTAAPIQIESTWSQCMVTNNMLVSGSVVDEGADNIIWGNSETPGGGGGGGVAGVSSFKGRTGAVAPKTGDYTPAMVGAATEAYVNSQITQTVGTINTALDGINGEVV